MHIVARRYASAVQMAEKQCKKRVFLVDGGEVP